MEPKCFRGVVQVVKDKSSKAPGSRVFVLLYMPIVWLNLHYRF